LEKKRILVVDDDKSQVKSLTEILRLEGFDVDSAETGREAIEKYKAQLYDLVLLDIRLSDMKGTEVLKIIDGQPTKTVRIVITGYPATESTDEAMDMKADAYLVKPVDPEKLIKTMHEKLNKQQ
jgi:DNA-binding NtrC family response regulator